MATVRVLRPFRDLKEHQDREPGDEFFATDDRASEIAERLPGYVEVTGDPEPEKDLASMTKSDLLKAAASRGISVSPKATKQTIIELLEA